MRTPVSLVALLVLGSLGGCGQDSPLGDDPGFARTSGDTRLVARYDQDATRATYDVTVPAGATHLRIRIDCVAKSRRDITVRVGSVGAGAFQCGERSSPGGAIGLSGAVVARAGDQQVSVTTPPGAYWSFAVDAG